MKQSFFLLLGSIFLFSTTNVKAGESATADLKNHRMVTINQSVRCPAATVNECLVTATADDDGVITITITGASVVPVENLTAGVTVQEVADFTAIHLDAHGSIPIVP